MQMLHGFGRNLLIIPEHSAQGDVLAPAVEVVVVVTDSTYDGEGKLVEGMKPLRFVTNCVDLRALADALKGYASEAEDMMHGTPVARPEPTEAPIG